MDVHVPAAITRALLSRGVDVLTAQADGTSQLSDKNLLDRSGRLHRILFTRDEDFVAEATECHRRQLSLAGVIYAHQ
jgi:predicted nuclease of predicted toxin-antitoxin system